jgi:hypothetical protein
MENAGKYNTVKIIMSGIATAAGLILILLKFYPHIGLILLSFGIVILAFSLEERRKGIVSDELIEWISGKAAVLSFWVAYSTIVLLLAIDIYKPDFIETYIALGIVMISMTFTVIAGQYYYEKISKKIGF